MQYTDSIRFENRLSYCSLRSSCFDSNEVSLQYPITVDGSTHVIHVKEKKHSI
jgi:hypothetical protein